MIKKYIPFLKNYSTYDPEGLMNRIALLFDGKADLNSIYIAWGKQNPTCTINKIKSDVDITLEKFAKTNSLFWKDDIAPPQRDFSELYTKKMGKCTMAIYMEKYLPELLDFISHFNLPCDRSEITRGNDSFVFTAANISPLLFNKLFIRLKTFEFSQAFFMLINEHNDIEIIIEAMVENIHAYSDIAHSSVATINLIACRNWIKNKKQLPMLFNFLENNIERATCRLITKFRLVLSHEDLESNKEFVLLLTSCGYKHEHTFEKECENHSITFFSKIKDNPKHTITT